MTSRPLRSAASTFAVYAVLSAVPVVALGLVLDGTYRHAAHEQGVAQGRAQADVIHGMAISPALSGDDLTLGLSTGERKRLSTATDLAVFTGSVVRLRLRDFDGRVVFADDGRLDVPATGADSGVLPTSAAFAAAAVGRTSTDIVERPGGPAVRVLRPVMASASGRSTGVLEVYLPYGDIAAAVDHQVRDAWQRLMIGLALLYAVLALLSWSTSRNLRRHAAQREHESLHDALTGLPNRTLFHARAERLVASATPEQPVALVLVDLDRFKHVNDTLGHHAGDALLVAVAERLRTAVRSSDTVARLGGDEFGLVLPGVTDERTAVALLDELRATLAEDLVLEGVILSVESSIGVALAPQHGRDVETVLRRADEAMYRGKRGSRSVVVAGVCAEPTAAHALSLHAEIRQAVERDELVLHYQPKIDLRTGRTVAVEALVRWAHPRRGLLGPGEFLSAVEQSDLVGPFTAWVLRRALHDLAAWSAAGLDWSVAVNVSARNLEAEGFAREVADLVEQAGVPPSRVVVEITETALAADRSAVARTVHGLAACGFVVSVDDFGTGWSSLTQLRELPVSEVKIDRSFVKDLDGDPQDRELVRSVVQLAHGLACRVVAEGVESQETADWLREVGCDEAQGFLWSRPVPWPELSSLPTGRPAPRALVPTASGGTP